MTRILYKAPDDVTRILDPSPEQISDIILNQTTRLSRPSCITARLVRVA